MRCSFSVMCSLFENMHRYTSLIWNSEKKTLFGKNGVSWLSIFLGTFVVILIIGVFVQCIREVKKARQESDAQLRKSILEKRLSSTTSPTTDIPHKYFQDAEDQLVPDVIPAFDNDDEKPVNSTLASPLPMEFDDIEYLGHHMLGTRKRRNIIADRQSKKRKIRKLMEERLKSQVSTFATLEEIKEENSTELKDNNTPVLVETIENVSTLQPEQSTNSEIDSKQVLEAPSFLEKLADAKVERLKRETAVYDVLEEVLSKQYELKKKAERETKRLLNEFELPMKNKDRFTKKAISDVFRMLTSRKLLQSSPNVKGIKKSSIVHLTGVVDEPSSSTSGLKPPKSSKLKWPTVNLHQINKRSVSYKSMPNLIELNKDEQKEENAKKGSTKLKSTKNGFFGNLMGIKRVKKKLEVNQPLISEDENEASSSDATDAKKPPTNKPKERNIDDHTPSLNDSFKPLIRHKRI